MITACVKSLTIFYIGTTITHMSAYAWAPKVSKIAIIITLLGLETWNRTK